MKKYIIGIDEAGRGPWAGPVAAGACIFLKTDKNLSNLKKALNDSKKLTERQRESLLKEIFILESRGILATGMGMIDNTIIDTIGIKKANKLAMQTALEDLLRKIGLPVGELIIQIDGNDRFSLHETIPSESIVRGDTKVKQISAASIVAKVTRDHLMQEYSKKFPEYGFELHKGYGTKKHVDALEKHGVCPLHRVSYAPIKRVLEKNGF